jgi:hypothetical protein
LSEYALKDICHTGHPFALIVAFALKQRNVSLFFVCYRLAVSPKEIYLIPDNFAETEQIFDRPFEFCGISAFPIRYHVPQNYPGIN